MDAAGGRVGGGRGERLARAIEPNVPQAVGGADDDLSPRGRRRGDALQTEADRGQRQEHAGNHMARLKRVTGVAR